MDDKEHQLIVEIQGSTPATDRSHAQRGTDHLSDFAVVGRTEQQEQGWPCDTSLHGCSSSKILTSRQCRAPAPLVLTEFPVGVNQTHPWQAEAWHCNLGQDGQCAFIQRTQPGAAGYSGISTVLLTELQYWLPSIRHKATAAATDTSSPLTIPNIYKFRR